MTVYVLTLDGYVHGAFRNLSKAHAALESIEPQSILYETGLRPRSWSKWNLQYAFRRSRTGYVSVICGDCMYELTKTEVI